VGVVKNVSNLTNLKETLTQYGDNGNINSIRFKKRQQLNRLIGTLPDWAIDTLISIINNILLNSAECPDWADVTEVNHE